MNVRPSAGLRLGFAAALTAAWLVSMISGPLGGQPAAAVAAEPRTIAAFDFELVDTSLQGELQGASREELDRLRRIGDLLRERLAESGRYRVVDTAPAADEIARAGRLWRCNGCAADIAAGLGAELALIGWVQKVSNLILNINVAVRDVAAGRLVAGGSVDIRGNTDESWSRGITYLIDNRLLTGRSRR